MNVHYKICKNNETVSFFPFVNTLINVFRYSDLNFRTTMEISQIHTELGLKRLNRKRHQSEHSRRNWGNDNEI